MVSKFYLFGGFAVFIGGFALSAFCDALGVPSSFPELVIVAAILGCIALPFRVKGAQDRSLALGLFGILGFLLSLFDLALHAKFVVSASMAWLIIAALGMFSMIAGGMKLEREAAKY